MTTEQDPPDPTDIYARVWPVAFKFSHWLQRWDDPWTTASEAVGLLYGLTRIGSVDRDTGFSPDPKAIRFLFMVAMKRKPPESRKLCSCGNGDVFSPECPHTWLREKARGLIAKKIFATEKDGLRTRLKIPRKLLEDDPSLIAHILTFFLHGNNGYPPGTIEWDKKDAAYGWWKHAKRFIEMLAEILADAEKKRQTKMFPDMEAFGDKIETAIVKDQNVRELTAGVILAHDIPDYGFLSVSRETLRILHKIAYTPDHGEKKPENLFQALEMIHGLNANAARRIPLLTLQIEEMERRERELEIRRIELRITELKEQKKAETKKPPDV